MTTKTIVLAGCGAAKREELARASAFYTSRYCDLKRRYAEAGGDRWAIFYAQHGLLSLERTIKPYDTTMQVFDAARWGRDMGRSLAEYIPGMPPVGSEDVVVTILAGTD